MNGGALVSVASAGSNSEREKENDNMCVYVRGRDEFAGGTRFHPYLIVDLLC